MSRLAEVFAGRRHVVLPVIHVDDREQAMRNAEVARAAGADGVFLINHGIRPEIPKDWLAHGFVFRLGTRVSWELPSEHMRSHTQRGEGHA